MADERTGDRHLDGAEPDPSLREPDEEFTKIGRITAEQLQAAARVVEAGLRRLHGRRTALDF